MATCIVFPGKIILKLNANYSAKPQMKPGRVSIRCRMIPVRVSISVGIGPGQSNAFSQACNTSAIATLG